MKDEVSVCEGARLMRRMFAPVITAGVVVISGCSPMQIFPINSVFAVVYGDASADGRPLAGAYVTAFATRGGCVGESVALGATIADSAGRFRVRIQGGGPKGLYCLRVSAAVSAGDTLIARDSVFLQAESPFDSVRVDVQR